MICPKCKSDQLRCLDTRPRPESVRRRRECMVCGHRFSTIEISQKRFADLETKERILKMRRIAETAK